MKTDKLANAIGDVPDELIQEAEFKATRQPRSWVKWVAAAACLVVAVVIAMSGVLNPKSAEVDIPVDTQTGEPVNTLPFETVAGADIAGFDPVETALYSDDEIAKIVSVLQSDRTRDWKLENECHEALGEKLYMLIIHGYHTNSDTLQVSAPIPFYMYEDGVFTPEWPEEYNAPDMFLFDGDDIVYVMARNPQELVDEYGEDVMPPYFAQYMYHETEDIYIWEDNTYLTEYSLGDAYAESTTKQFAVIYAADGWYLYDGVKIWHVAYTDELRDICDYLEDDPIATPGLEDLELGNALERQTFEYESEPLTIEVNGQTATDVPLDDYVDTLASML